MPSNLQSPNTLIQPIKSKRVRKVIQDRISDTENILVQLSGNCDQTLVITPRQIYIIKPGFTAQAGFGTKFTKYDINQITSVELTRVFQTWIFWLAGPEIISPFNSFRDSGFEVFYTARNCIPFTYDQKPLFEEALQVIHGLITRSHCG
ncbi:MAG TPA: hypothetical protein VHS59_02995 [Bacillota bacterium]|nr:hypothetical protein [Bacillota bacterium]